ncbi:colicin-like pore-forming protein [Pseudomonas carassii]|uniref:Colicin-like pore-forming protein n=1 Tax=Pseudomonas carassii TaxID=3115855 RepID=A0ABU7HCZ9_9PSED|nr:colicin-like pore-forming protein [Pseudomonas sp. 137P]MEE1888481.1 colicin-like pore-forming protein [Pseudomonas sp. 137P]
MGEKNIIVDRGIPPSGSSGGGGRGGSSTGGITIPLGVNGEPSQHALNVAALMNGAVLEAVLEGQGWPSPDAYYDLGVDMWGMLPYQIVEMRNELSDSYLRKERNLPASLNAELAAAEAAAGSTAALPDSKKAERSIGIIKSMMAARDQQIAFNRGRLATEQGGRFDDRDIKELIDELRKLDEYDVPAALDVELSLYTAALALYVDLKAQEQLREKLDAQEKALRDAREKEFYKDAATYASDIGKEISSRYGERVSQAARDLQKDISGKRVRSYQDALKTFEKMSSNPGWKLNAKDAAAVSQALRALDKATLGDNMTRLGKAFGVTGGVIQAQGLVDAAATGFQTGEWKPFLLEMESAVVGKIAGSAAGAMLGITLGLLGVTLAGSAALIVGGVLVGLASSYFDPEKVDQINNWVLDAVGA